MIAKRAALSRWRDCLIRSGLRDEEWKRRLEAEEADEEQAEEESEEEDGGDVPFFEPAARFEWWQQWGSHRTALGQLQDYLGI